MPASSARRLLQALLGPGPAQDSGVFPNKRRLWVNGGENLAEESLVHWVFGMTVAVRHFCERLRIEGVVCFSDLAKPRRNGPIASGFNPEVLIEPAFELFCIAHDANPNGDATERKSSLF